MELWHLEGRQVSRSGQCLVTSISGRDSQTDLKCDWMHIVVIENQQAKFHQDRRRSCKCHPVFDWFDMDCPSCISYWSAKRTYFYMLSLEHTFTVIIAICLTFNSWILYFKSTISAIIIRFKVYEKHISAGSDILDWLIIAEWVDQCWYVATSVVDVEFILCTISVVLYVESGEVQLNTLQREND